MRWESEIRAAHPLVTGRHDIYAIAMNLVNERTSKSEMVDLVNFLLAAFKAKAEAAPK